MRNTTSFDEDFEDEQNKYSSSFYLSVGWWKWNLFERRWRRHTFKTQLELKRINFALGISSSSFSNNNNNNCSFARARVCTYKERERELWVPSTKSLLLTCERWGLEYYDYYYYEYKRTRFESMNNTLYYCFYSTPSRNTRKSNLSYRLFCARPCTTGSRTGPRSSRWLSLLCLLFARFEFLLLMCFNAYNRFSEKEREE